VSDNPNSPLTGKLAAAWKLDPNAMKDIVILPEWVAKASTYLREAKTFALRSKDPSTKVGALILDNLMGVRAQGWNGAARGCKADTDHRFDRPEKYYWSVHAEQNAIANAARAGIALQGCTMVVTHPPCMVCANLIVQSGIGFVITNTPSEDFKTRWQADMDRVKVLFQETGVLQWFV
jgi:dCMP deaminase